MTDLQVFETLVEQATVSSSGQAIEALSDALGMIRGVPFDAVGYEWAHEQQLHARACEAIEAAALRLVDLAFDADAITTARFAVTQGLIALPVNEPLYRARMRIEAAADNPPGVHAAFQELTGLLDEMSTDGFCFEPSGPTRSLLSELTTRVSTRH